MLEWLQTNLVDIIWAAIPIGTIAFLVLQQAKRLSYAVDALPALTKRIAVGIIAVLLTVLFDWAGVPLVCEEGVNCLSSLNIDSITALLNAVLGSVIAMVIHAKKNS